jgi:hypothetical protein
MSPTSQQLPPTPSSPRSNGNPKTTTEGIRGPAGAACLPAQSN